MTIEAILFDFDGVIIDSMAVRDFGFREILKEYPAEQVERLIAYHRTNAGLSRFAKLEHFYANILREPVSRDRIMALAGRFSEIMIGTLTDPGYLIADTVDFIRANHRKYDMHIVSGSEEKELNFLCEKLGIADYFLSIKGSPTHKNELVASIIREYHYDRAICVLVGDSITDFEAAKTNGVVFIGYNNVELRSSSNLYLDSFASFDLNSVERALT